MAGWWIKNKIDPGKAFDKDLYTLEEDEVKNSTVCGSLREAMKSLLKMKVFNLRYVFTDDQIDVYTDLKFKRFINLTYLHPIEFVYYSLKNYTLKDLPPTSLSVSLGFSNKLWWELFYSPSLYLEDGAGCRIDKYFYSFILNYFIVSFFIFCIFHRITHSLSTDFTPILTPIVLLSASDIISFILALYPLI